jgi:hypothetical protein
MAGNKKPLNSQRWMYWDVLAHLFTIPAEFYFLPVLWFMYSCPPTASSRAPSFPLLALGTKQCLFSCSPPFLQFTPHISRLLTCHTKARESELKRNVRAMVVAWFQLLFSSQGLTACSINSEKLETGEEKSVFCCVTKNLSFKGTT